MARRKQLVDSTLALVNAMFTAVSAFITFRLISLRLGVEIFGLWALVSAALFSLRFADLSINSAVMRYVGVIRGAGLRKAIAKITLAAIAINLIAFVGFLLPSVLLAPGIIHSTVDRSLWPQAMALAPFLVVAALLQLVAGVFLGAMLGLNKYRFVYATGIGVACLQVALILPALTRFGIAGYAILQSLLYLAQAILFATILSRVPEDEENGERATFHLRELVGYAFKFNANALLATMLDPLSKLLLGRFGTLAAVGTYEIVWRIYQQVRTMLVAPLQPLAIAMIRQHGDAPDAFARSYEVSLLYSISVSVLILLSGLPAAYVFQPLLHLHDASTPFVVASVVFSVSAGFVSVPAYNAALASNFVRPLLLSTVVGLGTIAAAGFVLGQAMGTGGVLIAISGGIGVSNLALIFLVARAVRFSAFPPPRRLTGYLFDALGEFRGMLTERRRKGRAL